MMLGCGILIGIIAGGGGVATTDLTATVSSNQTYLPVKTTTDFLDEDYVVVGQEKIFYTSKNSTAFLSCTRGYGNTTVSEHLAGARVYTATASAVNNALGFNMVAVQDEWGWAAIIAVPFMFFTRTVPQIIRMSTNLLTGDLAIISWVFYVMAAGFVITLALAIISARRVT